VVFFERLDTVGYLSCCVSIFVYIVLAPPFFFQLESVFGRAMAHVSKHVKLGT
jgi:hypothetical protein